MNAKRIDSSDHSMLAVTAAGAVRTVFGLVWAIDAYFKWQPAFLDNYLSYITGIVTGQPQWLLPWFNLWVKLITPDPTLFAWMTRLIETALAAGLLFGVLRKWTYLLGGLFALLIWSIPEGFGGPYTPGATDVGAGLIYILVFVALIIVDYVLGRSPYSLDFYLERLIPTWSRVAEWAPAHVLEQEPRRLSWTVQIVTIIIIVVLLVVFLTILSGELSSAPAQSSLPSVIHLVFLPLLRL
ncbi:MAG: hypothetical protein ABSB41_02770 [Anaerolineales bacterium]